MEKKKITAACVISDDTTYNKVQASLRQGEFVFERFRSDIDLLREARRRAFDLIIVDIGTVALADTRIVSWLSCLSGSAAPFILISATGSPEQVATGLNAGADEYVFNPFAEEEFAARINAALRRCDQRHTPRTLNVRGFALDRETGQLRDNGIPADLTPREFMMAWLFFSSPGIYLSREAISNAIWGTGCSIAGRTIEQHVYKLRKKLKLSEARGVAIRTAYTRGYRLELIEFPRAATAPGFKSHPDANMPDERKWPAVSNRAAAANSS